MIDKIKGALFGMAVGDALGVPVEFRPRSELRLNPIQTMTGHGTWDQPPGTWSDDSSMAFCLAESLTNGYNLESIAGNFVNWYNNGFWGAHNKPFEVGGTTRNAISRLMKGVSPEHSGGSMENENGNGSLMRILPLVFYIKDLDIEARYERVKEVSAITHAHFRSVFGCFIYTEMALLILNGYSAHDAYAEMKKIVKEFGNSKDFNKEELVRFDRILKANIHELDEPVIHTVGNVLHTLEASLWCVLTTDNYKDTVLKAVNLGEDTDTTACVAGGMAGLLYGYKSIPEDWVKTLARSNDVDDLCSRLNQKINV